MLLSISWKGKNPEKKSYPAPKESSRLTPDFFLYREREREREIETENDKKRSKGSQKNRETEQKRDTEKWRLRER